MKTFIKTGSFIFVMTIMSIFSVTRAATITLNTGATINYSAAGIANGDVVIVRTGTTLVVDGTYSCSALTLGSNTTNGTIVFNVGSQLTVTGALTMGGAGGGLGSINMTNGGKLIMGNGSSFTISNAASTLTPGTGTIQIAGAMTLPANITTYNNLEINRAASTINLGVNTICNGYVNVMAGTLHTTAAGNFNLTALGTFTVAAGATFVSNNSVVTCQGTVTLNGTITTGTGQLIYKGNFVNNGTYTIGNGTTVFGGTTTVSGTVATQPFYNVQINAGANVTLPAACTVGNNWTNNGGTVIPGTGTVTFNSTTANQSITGTATTHTFYNLTINKAAGFGLAFAGSATTLNVNNLTQTLGNFTACATVNLTGNYVHTAGTFTANSGNMNFNGTGAQAISGIATAFFKLTVDKASGTLTQTAASNSVTNTMIMTAGTFNVGTTTLNGAANFTATGGDFQSAKLGTIPEFTGATYSISGGTISLNGAGNQTLKPSVSYYNVLLGTSGTKTISTVTSIQKDLIVSGTAVFTGNAAFTVGGTLIYASSGSTTLSAGTNVSIGNFLQSTGTFIDNGVQITVTDSVWMRNGGTFTTSGITLFNSAGTDAINGNVSTTFNKLYKQGVGTLNIQTATSVNTELNISNGTVDAAANSLTGSAAVNMSGGMLALAKNGVTIPELTGAYTMSGGTVKLYGAGAQTVRALNYYHLDLTAGTKTFLNGSTGIGATLTLNSNPTLDFRTNSSTVNYNGTGSFSAQTVQPLSYYNLTLNPGTKTFAAGTTAIAGVLDPVGPPVVDLRTNSTTILYDGTGSNLSQVIPSLNYYNLQFGASGTKTFGSGTTKISGAFTTLGASADAMTNSSTISYDGAGSQTVAAINYYNLDLNAGMKTIESGTTGVGNAFTLTSNPVVDLRANNSTLSYNGAGAQDIQPLNYHNLDLGSSGNKSFGATTTKISGSISSSGGIGITSTNLSTIEYDAAVSQNVYGMNYYNLNLSGADKTFAGTTGISGALSFNSAANIDLRSNNSTIVYNGSGAQTIRALDYYNLSIGSSTGNKTFEAGTTRISGNMSSTGVAANAISNSSTIEFDGTSTQTISSSALSNYYNLTNNNTSNLTLTGYTTLKNTLTLGAGSVITNTGSLVFLSDTNSTARLAEVPADAVFNGFITMQRYIPQIPYNYLHYYHIVGSPVSSSFGALTYNESNTGFIDQGFSCDTCYTTLTAGVGGFRDFGSAALVYTYPSGAPNRGVVVVNVTNTNSGVETNDGWNLISNPYPSEILWDNVQLNGVGASAYVWNGIQYDEHIQGDGYIIPSGQGFWIKASSSGTVTFRESDKTIGASTFLRQANSPNYPQLVMKMTGNGYSDEADVRFIDDATSNFDYEHDAYKLNGHQNAPHLSTKAMNGDELSINSLPALTQNYDIPVVARCAATGSYQMSIESLSGFASSACITLEDLVTGTIYDLRNTSTFSFTQTGTSVSSVRFILHIGAPVAMEIHDAVCENGNYNGSVEVHGLVNGPWSYQWQDAAGNVLHSTLNTNGGDSMSGLSSGTYTLIIHSASGNCAVTSETFTIQGPAPIAGNALVTSASCNGNADGAIDLTPTGGQGALQIQWSDNSTAEDKNGLSAGSYSLVITDATGCAHHESIDVSQPDEIIAAITPSASHIYLCNGGWASFANQSTGATNYAWDFGDGSPVFNGITAAHQYTAAGLYTVTLTASNGACVATTQQLIMVEQNPTGIQSIDLQNGVSVFSENGLISVRFNLPYERKVDVRITNILGQEVFHSNRYQAFRNTLEAELSEVTEGLYLLHISQENKVVTKKFLFRK